MEFCQRVVNGVVVADISGQIRISTQNECKEYFDNLVKTYSNTNIILNMSGIGYINSAGIGMIIDTFKKFRKNGGRLVLCRLVSDIAKLFEVTKLDRFIEIYDNEEEAIKKLNEI